MQWQRASNDKAPVCECDRGGPKHQVHPVVLSCVEGTRGSLVPQSNPMLSEICSHINFCETKNGISVPVHPQYGQYMAISCNINMPIHGPIANKWHPRESPLSIATDFPAMRRRCKSGDEPSSERGICRVKRVSLQRVRGLQWRKIRKENNYTRMGWMYVDPSLTQMQAVLHTSRKAMIAWAGPLIRRFIHSFDRTSITSSIWTVQEPNAKILSASSSLHPLSPRSRWSFLCFPQEFRWTTLGRSKPWHQLDSLENHYSKHISLLSGTKSCWLIQIPWLPGFHSLPLPTGTWFWHPDLSSSPEFHIQPTTHFHQTCDPNVWQLGCISKWALPMPDV